MLADEYDELYSSVPYDSTEMDAIARRINRGLLIIIMTLL